MVVALGLTLLVNPVVAEENDNNDYTPLGKESFNRFSWGLHGGLYSGFTDVKRYDFVPAKKELTLGGGLALNYHVSPALTFQSVFSY